jgi:hypothetical protein
METLPSAVPVGVSGIVREREKLEDTVIHLDRFTF